jgi:hypothetical protein
MQSASVSMLTGLTGDQVATSTRIIVCGFTEGKGSRKHFGALIWCAYRNGKLRYFGHSGTGFSKKAMKETIDLLPCNFYELPVTPYIPQRNESFNHRTLLLRR